MKITLKKEVEKASEYTKYINEELKTNFTSKEIAKYSTFKVDDKKTCFEFKAYLLSEKEYNNFLKIKELKNDLEKAKREIDNILNNL